MHVWWDMRRVLERVVKVKKVENVEKSLWNEKKVVSLQSVS
jgi:hypothetical protein